tara:strand:+ start:1000 stop:2610 length:1611 start_codon:yes stop_codon:yes gene_type:complete
MSKKFTAEGRYSSLEPEKSLYLDRAIECSKYTLPTLITDNDRSSGRNAYTKINTTYQGLGARGVNNLAAKLLVALLPPNQAFFRLSVDDMKLQQELENYKDLQSNFDQQLSLMERAVMRDIEESGDRTALFEALKHLIIGGNALLYVADNGTRVYPLKSFCLNRDPEGNILEVVVREEISPDVLPDGVAKKTHDGKYVDQTCFLYTYIEWDHKKDKCYWYQEAYGKRIGQQGSTPIEKSPWIPLRLYRVAHEAYGRSFCEELLGDLKSLEFLSKAIVEGSAASARILFLCNPNGTTRPDSLARAANGAIVAGNPDDVAPLQMQKQADLTVALNTIARIEQRLSFSFLLNSAIQAGAAGRDRVTAEEIRMVTNELETGLGGVYSILSVEMQLPLVHRKMAMMERQKRLPRLPKNIVKPRITTGLDALGRGNDKAKLIEFIQTLAQTMGPETMAQFVNTRELITRLAASDGLETYKLIKSEDDLAQEQQQQAMMMQQQQAAQDPQNDPAKQAALIKAENDSIRTDQETAPPAGEEGGI